MIAFTILALGIVLFLPPYLDGIARKVKARIQHRRGPPLMQTWYDLVKLLSIPSVIPTRNWLFKLYPYLAFASAIVAALLLPYGGVIPLKLGYNLIVFFYAILMVSVFLMLAGFSVQNAFSHLGSAREMMLILTVEPLLAIVYGILAYNAGSLDIGEIISNLHLTPSLIVAYAILAYSMYVESGFVPFDVAEAETEVIGGPLAEYSGRLLGIFYYAIHIKRFALLWFFVSLVVLPLVPITTQAKALLALLLQLLLTLALYPVIASLEATNARLRIDQVAKVNVRLFFASIIVFAMSFLGW
ncbi:respiratory chain complex I subunit 1 family protein [Pyrococcus abyssi]|uniref:Hydrogenase 4, component C or formate hydrogen lyase, subunit 4 n=1 Tax=Pyrococcus abyssi (strain GE5 / Orsay) TaxID=272844 RepID=Q9UYN3_PYRAB|nr:respiratory chain complex I subunit 1 family protein [Pyrococcus abyssi]CAB50379.1 Hydrogenase 4, component C or formate hydrogen lyase, subunit 4 [Pyrococcus abyssi GE5]CCE70926.1 TPA: hydrogenase-4 component c [Pyrococcus abyssi GE5]